MEKTHRKIIDQKTSTTLPRVVHIFLFCCVFLLLWWILHLSSVVHAEDIFDELQIFKDETLSQVYDVDEYMPLMDLQEAQVTLGQLSSSYDEMQKTLEWLQERRDEIGSHYSKAKRAVTQIVGDMKNTHDKLLKRQRDISLTVWKIQTLDRIVSTLSKDIWQTQEYITLYAKMLFKVTNDYYLNDEEMSTLKLFSKSNNIAESLSKDDLVKLLYWSLDMMFAQVESYYDQYRTSLQNIRVTVNEYNDEIQTYKDEIQLLEKQRDHTIELLKYLDDDVSYIQKKISEIDRSKENVRKQMDRMSDVSESTVSFLDGNSSVRKLLDEKDKKEWPTYFSWPVRIVTGMLTSDQVGVYEWEKWLILEADQGQSVHAPAPWIVYKVEYNDDLSVNRLILLHKYWYSTLVMPLEEIFVAQWSVVKRGEILWTAWWRPWMNGSWLWSKRSHVYLELLKNGNPSDVFLHYDLSVFSSQDQVDERYHLKWKQDYLQRRIDLSGLPTLQWETTEQRRNYFLSRSGGSVFWDPDVRIRAAKGTWIDPIFGICIWAAETSYRNFKSWNNIGNVWNDDSWNTRAFTSAEQWIRAVFNTLNNRYLNQYHSMDQLSRFWNKDSYIYASDPINRQKNIMRCLSMIYDTPVPEQYFFRDVN